MPSEIAKGQYWNWGYRCSKILSNLIHDRSLPTKGASCRWATYWGFADELLPFAPWRRPKTQSSVKNSAVILADRCSKTPQSRRQTGVPKSKSELLSSVSLIFSQLDGRSRSNSAVERPVLPSPSWHRNTVGRAVVIGRCSSREWNATSHCTHEPWISSVPSYVLDRDPESSESACHGHSIVEAIWCIFQSSLCHPTALRVPRDVYTHTPNCVVSTKSGFPLAIIISGSFVPSTFTVANAVMHFFSSQLAWTWTLSEPRFAQVNIPSGNNSQDVSSQLSILSWNCLQELRNFLNPWLYTL